jgi:hypothetical protein
LHEKWEILGLASIFFFQLKTIYILEAVFWEVLLQNANITEELITSW